MGVSQTAIVNALNAAFQQTDWTEVTGVGPVINRCILSSDAVLVCVDRGVMAQRSVWCVFALLALLLPLEGK